MGCVSRQRKSSAEADRKLLWTRGALLDNSPVNYGFGWYVDSSLNRTRLNHDGQFPRFRADYERFPDDKLSVIILANLDNPLAGGLL